MGLGVGGGVRVVRDFAALSFVHGGQGTMRYRGLFLPI